MNRHRVVITGIGLVSPVGISTSQSWKSVVNGISGISKANFDTPPHASAVVGCINDIQEKLNLVLSPAEIRKTDRFIQLAVIAANEALKDAGLNHNSPIDRSRFGSYVGVGIGGFPSIEEASLNFAQRGYRAISPFLLPKVISNEAPAWLSIKFNLQGPTMAIVNACSSGNDAIGQAFRAIQDGHADYMIAGGSESCLSSMAFAGFGNMRALSSWNGDPSQASRPFDKNRSGFVMAEGAGLLLLEREDLARKRGAKVYAEMAGYGASSDAHHITAIHPEGVGAIRAIKSALKQAKINKEQITYVNAHGTATPMNDPAETNILKSVFGNHAKKLLVSSTKSMTGHMLGAAGGVEAAFTALAIKNNTVPPTINLEEPDPTCDLDYVAHHAKEKNIDYALSNSFGFGGANSVLLFKKYH
jgi:3-oxoacyl-[acyl-carrier-protein] synthase II